MKERWNLRGVVFALAFLTGVTSAALTADRVGQLDAPARKNWWPFELKAPYASVRQYSQRMIQLPVAEFDSSAGEPRLPRELTADLIPGDLEYAYYIVQFEGPVREDW
ncbi:hypothetical protein JW905_15910, partial [bacterium]|nr:hypothetical protein [candidate division CSSED10-310 bacterium]